MKKYLFVINPVSGGSNKDDLIQTIENEFSQNEFSIWMTTGTNDQIKLDQEIKSYNPDTVVIAGGDGTINQMVLVINDNNKELGVIPSGSANGLATDLGITLNNWLPTIRNGKESDLDIIMINNNPMIHMADIGLNASLVKRYEDENRRGFLGYTISALKELPAINQEFGVKISSNSEKQTYHTSFLVIANSQRYGTGFQINPDGKVNDGKFEVCIMKPLKPDTIFSQVFQPDKLEVERGIFETLSSNKAEIHLEEKINFQIDGEFIEETNYLKVEMNNKAAKLLIP